MRKLFVAVLVIAVLAVAAAQALAAARSVKIGDDYFVRKGSTPTVTVRKGTKVTWRWTGKDLHNIAVTKGPAKFASTTQVKGSYSKKLTKKGTYTILCTIHAPDMKMTVRVK